MKIPTISPLVRIAVLVGAGVMAFFLVSWGIDWWTGRGQERFKAKAATAHAGTEAAAVIAAKKDTVYLQGETVYIRTRDALLNPGPGKPPASPEVKACFAAAEDLRSKCNERHVADVALSDSLRKELKVWQDKPISREPRFQPYVEGLYDFMAPATVLRVGATAKLLGRVSITTAADYSIAQSGERGKVRALAGVRIQF